MYLHFNFTLESPNAFTLQTYQWEGIGFHTNMLFAWKGLGNDAIERPNRGTFLICLYPTKALDKAFNLRNLEVWLQVNLFQKHSFLIQLTHNMTTDCSLITDFSTRKIQVQNMLCTKIVLNAKSKNNFWFWTCIFLVPKSVNHEQSVVILRVNLTYILIS